MIVYGVKGYQPDVDGAIYDQAFFIDKGDFSLQTNLDMNGFEIKNYDRGYTIEDDEIDFEKNIDLNKKRIIGLKDADRDGAAVNLKQVTDLLNNLSSKLNKQINIKQDKSYYKLIFEYFFDLLDPDSFDMENSYGSNIESVGGKLRLGSTVSLSDFDVKDGFKIKYSDIRLDDIFDHNTDFTIFISFLHDVSFTGDNYTISLGRRAGVNITIFPPLVIIKNDKFILKEEGTNKSYEESLTSAYRNKHLFFWFCKQGNTYKAIICQGGHINKTMVSRSFQANCVCIHLPYKVQRIGFSKNFYNLYEKEFHKISFLEKAN